MIYDTFYTFNQLKFPAIIKRSLIVFKDSNMINPQQHIFQTKFRTFCGLYSMYKIITQVDLP